MKSIRQYLRNRIILGSAALLSTGSILLALAIRHLDILEFDATLEAKARTLATLVLRDHDTIEVDFAGEFMPEFETAGNTEYFQFRLLDGSVVERSDMLGAYDLPFVPYAVGRPFFSNLRLPDGRPGRFVQIAFPVRASDEQNSIEKAAPPHQQNGNNSATAHIVLAVAQSRAGLDALLRKVYLALAVIDVLLVGMIAVLVRGALRRGLLPLADLNHQISRLGPDNLDQRVNLRDAPSEIAVFPKTINSVMEALHAAFVRERRFTSDVAHELRTPVAEFRAACEVGAKWSDDPALVRRRFENLQNSAVNMERMLNRLLDLSQLEKGTFRIQPNVVVIAAIIDSCWERICGGDVGFVHRLKNSVEQSLRLHTDPDVLEQILFNLLSNAIYYSSPESVIVCENAYTSNGACELRISNYTDDLDQEDISHIFERFWRKDAARTGGSHSGLGLSIVQALSHALEIELVVDLTAKNLFTVRLRFPEQKAV